MQWSQSRVELRLTIKSERRLVDVYYNTAVHVSIYMTSRIEKRHSTYIYISFTESESGLLATFRYIFYRMKPSRNTTAVDVRAETN